jgi:hypothetical protein
MEHRMPSTTTSRGACGLSIKVPASMVLEIFLPMIHARVISTPAHGFAGCEYVMSLFDENMSWLLPHTVVAPCTKACSNRMSMASCAICTWT